MQFPSSAWGFQNLVYPKEHSEYFYHHSLEPVMKINRILSLHDKWSHVNLAGQAEYNELKGVSF